MTWLLGQKPIVFSESLVYGHYVCELFSEYESLPLSWYNDKWVTLHAPIGSFMLGPNQRNQIIKNKKPSKGFIFLKRKTKRERERERKSMSWQQVLVV